MKNKTKLYNFHSIVENKPILNQILNNTRRVNQMDMEHHFHLAKIKDDNVSIKMLTEFENQLAQHIGGDVVLLAYKRNENEDEWK